MDRADSRDPDGQDMSDVPPIVACARCGRASCDGCFPSLAAPALPGSSPLPWEAKELGWKTFVDTALLTAEQPAVGFGQLRGGSLTRALTFACLAELLAVSSLALVAIPLGLALAPRFTGELLRSRSAWLGAGALVTLLSTGMVALHLLWGDFLERGVSSQGEPKDLRLGLRFGLYACGWDFITSPLGLLGAVQRRGRGFPGALLAASRVPRRAMHCYLADCRKLAEPAEQGAMRHMAKLFVWSSALFFSALLVGAIAFVVSIWP